MNQPHQQINGYLLTPILELENAFAGVLAGEMSELPFLHPTMPIKACGLQLFERQWVGVILTPWMMSAVILPGPQQEWPLRTVSGRLSLALPFANMTFTVGSLEGLPQYLACSLMSPVDKTLTAQQGVKLAEDCAKMLLSLPISEPKTTVNSSRRALLMGQRVEHRA